MNLDDPSCASVLKTRQKLTTREADYRHEAKIDVAGSPQRQGPSALAKEGGPIQRPARES
jgi:hypothetical protein